VPQPYRTNAKFVQVQPRRMASVVDFYFDLSCPYSFMSSLQINKLCSKYNVPTKWHPFLRSDQASKPYSNASSKLLYQKRLLYFHAQRVLNDHSFHRRLFQNVSTLDAMVYLATRHRDEANSSVIDSASALFLSVWTDRPSDQMDHVQTAIRDLKQSSKYGEAHQYLLSMTRAAATKHNLFGTPSIVVDGHLFYGLDRLPNVEAMLNPNCRALSVYRLKHDVLPDVKSNALEFFFDFSSPWAFLGFMRLHELRGFVERITFTPILLGALFRDIGTPNAPALAMSDRERNYGSLELQRWTKIAGVQLQFNAHFPIRTVLPLRVFIVDQRTIECIYRGAWQWNVNIGDEGSLCKLLENHGFDGRALIETAKSDPTVKRQLRDNTQRAKDFGMFGVPSYVVNGDHERFLWGQETLDLVKDALCGWTPRVKAGFPSKL